MPPCPAPLCPPPRGRMVSNCNAALKHSDSLLGWGLLVSRVLLRVMGLWLLVCALGVVLGFDDDIE